MRRLAVVSGALAVVCGAGAADARPTASGWFAEAGLGAERFTFKTAPDAAIGPELGVRVGRDLFPWLAVGLTLTASSHEATVPPPPEGEWFQLYRAAAGARLTGRFDRFAIFAEGDVGAAMISSNVLGKVGVTDPGETRSLAFQAGVGIAYQLENRHYAVGLAADLLLLPQFASLRAIDARLALRYTY
jgi:hypothetical protein